MDNKASKWVRGAIPALLLHCSIGTVYCWSIFSQEIANYIGWSKGATEWAFSLAIFFLGMSAAFMGNIVEKNIHKSSLIAAITFALGMAGTGFFIWYGGNHQHSVLALVGILVCYGFIMGIGLGTGYLSPVKTLMLWFKDQKGLATGLAVAGFGAAKAIASPIMTSMLTGLTVNKINNVGDGVYKMFLVLAAVYFVMMFVGHLLLAKPSDWVEPQTKSKDEGILATLKREPLTSYIGIWLMFYLNITCGLAFISQEKMIVKCIGLAGSVGIISTISAIFNAGGRLGFSAWADKMKDRNTIYKLIFILSIVFTAAVMLTGGIKNGAGNIVLTILVLALIFVVNAGYGGGFSNVPTLLSDHYGMGSISAIHGITLSAWAFAGLTGNQMANAIVKAVENKITAEGGSLPQILYHGEMQAVNPVGYQTVLYVTLALYVVSLCLSLFLVKPINKDKASA
ncbi:MAG: OFA family MFS transporter [Treponema sp.]|uniref:OFA family MFS transporter n=1 Tax=Treponema sp. TaxID=166 RepID=UPI00298DD88E|nr:OFA family MFS transporter [Treponema sp.]MCI5696509.1 OFA family MFS transporter [Spirochaetia bacterium]MDD5811339.1 OFA family MFS transporter [Treponema sp.]